MQLSCERRSADFAACVQCRGVVQLACGAGSNYACVRPGRAICRVGATSRRTTSRRGFSAILNNDKRGQARSNVAEKSPKNDCARGGAVARHGFAGAERGRPVRVSEPSPHRCHAQRHCIPNRLQTRHTLGCRSYRISEAGFSSFAKIVGDEVPPPWVRAVHH